MAKPAYQITNERTGTVFASEVRQAEGAWGNFKGLMLKKGMPEGHGLLFRPARGIHTHFMRFPIDLIFLDKDDRVSKIREAMPPWRFDFTSDAGVIEMNPGAARAAGLQPGDQLRFDPVETPS